MGIVRIQIEYDGAPFLGWQRQLQGPTIQGEIERALETIRGQPTTLYGAGRTDAGVHAEGQVAHFHLGDGELPPERWARALNGNLPDAIRVLCAEEAPEKFHSRNDAVRKRYDYRVLNRRVSSALDRRVLYYPGTLRWDRIREGSQRFVGEHDFLAFRAADGTSKTTVRRIYQFSVSEEGNGFFRMSVEGNGFLKQMVRTLAGTLLELGAGQRDLASIDRAFETKDRRLAGRTAPPEGLCLHSVTYPTPVFGGA